MTKAQAKAQAQVSEYALTNFFDPNGTTATNVFEMSERLMKKHPFYSAQTGGRSPIWRFSEFQGIWIPDGEDFVRKEVREAMAQFYNSHTANEVVSSIRASSYSTDIEFGGPSHRLVCENGTIDLDSGEFDSSFFPLEYHITRLPIKYDPKAKCTNFKKFLEEVVSSQDNRDAIMEFIGYMLLKEYIFEIIMLFVGEGANGKSVLLSVIKRLLGSENVSSVTPQQLEKSRFSSAQLYGKLACIAGDIPSKPLQFTGILKMLTGGDLIHAEHKHRDPFDFVNYAKLIFSANQVPESWDPTSAFYRRFRIIEFPNTFSPDSSSFLPRDVLLGKLTSETEKSGILNLVIESLKRLRDQGQLTGEQSVSQKRLDYIKRSDPAHYFFERFLFHDPEAPVIPKRDFYDMYVKYCRSQGNIPINNSRFGEKVKRLIPYSDEMRPREGDQRIMVWVGIGLNYELYDKEVRPGEVGQAGQGGQGKLASYVEGNGKKED